MDKQRVIRGFIPSIAGFEAGNCNLLAVNWYLDLGQRIYYARRWSLSNDHRDPELGAARPEPGASGDARRYGQRIHLDPARGARGAGHPRAAETGFRSRRWSAHRARYRL